MLRGLKLLEEKLFLDLVWDKAKFECTGGIQEEPIEKLISVQVTLTDAKTTKIKALLL